MIRTNRMTLVALLAAMLAALAASPLWAQTKQRPSLDDELMKLLQGEPVDDVDKGLSGPEKRKVSKPKEGADLKKKLSRELGTAAVSENENPALAIAQQMREAEGLIAQTQSGDRTQQVQEQIVAQLEKLIQQARKNCTKSSAAGSMGQQTASRPKVSQPAQKPGTSPAKPSAKPARTSNAAPSTGPSAKPDLGQIRAMIEKQLWGTLPEGERQQLLQLPMEEFLPKYEPLIIEYFKRLSEERGRGERREPPR